MSCAPAAVLAAGRCAGAHAPIDLLCCRLVARRTHGSAAYTRALLPGCGNATRAPEKNTSGLPAAGRAGELGARAGRVSGVVRHQIQPGAHRARRRGRAFLADAKERAGQPAAEYAQHPGLFFARRYRRRGGSGRAAPPVSGFQRSGCRRCAGVCRSTSGGAAVSGVSALARGASDLVVRCGAGDCGVGGNLRRVMVHLPGFQAAGLADQLAGPARVALGPAQPGCGRTGSGAAACRTAGRNAPAGRRAACAGVARQRACRARTQLHPRCQP